MGAAFTLRHPLPPGAAPQELPHPEGAGLFPWDEGKVNLGCQWLEGTEELGNDLQIEAASLQCGVLERGASAIPPKFFFFFSNCHCFFFVCMFFFFLWGISKLHL